MCEITPRSILSRMGLSSKEADVYLFLVKQGASTGGQISRLLKENRPQLYRVLKNLENKNMVEETMEYPTRFVAKPFQAVIALCVALKREEARLLEHSGREILKNWYELPTEENPIERFAIVQGRKRIYTRLLNMIANSKEQVLFLISGVKLSEVFQREVENSIFRKARKNGVITLFLTQNQEQREVLNSLLGKVTNGSLNKYVQGRYLQGCINFSARFIVKDEAETLIFVRLFEDVTGKDEEVCIWTNCRVIISLLRFVFGELWSKAKKADIEDYTL
jgi:sugar-specific transcriptional regulator TrmB